MFNKSDLLELLELRDTVREEEEELKGESSVHQNLKNVRRTSRLSFNPFTMLTDKQFKQHYRMSKTLADEMIMLLQPILCVQSASSIPIRTQVLVSLRLMATGAYQSCITQDYYHPACQSVISTMFDRVVDALNELAPLFISFPQTLQNRFETQTKFRQFNKIPGILGLIDCIVVKYLKPSVNKESFYHHKRGHAMNVQVDGSADLLIMDLSICPGSNNDQGIWNHNNIKEHMENLRSNGNIQRHERTKYYLIGDSGYSLSPILLTPIHNATPESPEARFTIELCKTRCRIEQLFGVWVNVWRILKRETALRYAPQKVAKVIVACTVLYNFCRLNGINNELYNLDEFNCELGLEEDVAMNFREGILERQQITVHLKIFVNLSTF